MIDTIQNMVDFNIWNSVLMLVFASALAEVVIRVIGRKHQLFLRGYIVMLVIAGVPLLLLNRLELINQIALDYYVAVEWAELVVYLVSSVALAYLVFYGLVPDRHRLVIIAVVFAFGFLMSMVTSSNSDLLDWEEGLDPAMLAWIGFIAMTVIGVFRLWLESRDIEEASNPVVEKLS